MGFYDARCAVTGLSLTWSDAVAVPLVDAGGRFRPLTLGVPGTYDRYGSIDGVDDGAHTALLTAWTADRVRDGRLVVAPGEPEVADLEDLLHLLERNSLALSDPATAEGYTTLDGATPVLALVERQVWDAVAASDEVGAESDEARLDRLFGDLPIAGDLYRNRVAEVADPLRQLSAVGGMMAARGIPWTPVHGTAGSGDVCGQHDVEDVRGFLDEARRTFADVAFLRPVFDAHGRTLAEHDEPSAGPGPLAAPDEPAGTVRRVPEAARGVPYVEVWSGRRVRVPTWALKLPPWGMRLLGWVLLPVPGRRAGPSAATRPER